VSQVQSCKEDLNKYLKKLTSADGPALLEEKARQAERGTLGYAQYLLELGERECQQWETVFFPCRA
jgi:hypothetical protein